MNSRHIIQSRTITRAYKISGRPTNIHVLTLIIICVEKINPKKRAFTITLLLNVHHSCAYYFKLSSHDKSLNLKHENENLRCVRADTKIYQS